MASLDRALALAERENGSVPVGESWISTWRGRSTKRSQ
jgi:hypothetical protein